MKDMLKKTFRELRLFALVVMLIFAIFTRIGTLPMIVANDILAVDFVCILLLAVFTIRDFNQAYDEKQKEIERLAKL